MIAALAGQGYDVKRVLPDPRRRAVNLFRLAEPPSLGDGAAA